MTIVYIGLGSNAGNRKKNIEESCLGIASLPKTKIIKTSPLYLTSPIGPKQRDFINGVVKTNTSLAPRVLLRYLKKIEKEIGRIKTRRRGPRIIDLDILIYGNRIVKSRSLTIPHPEMKNRLFVMEPLYRVASATLRESIKKQRLTLRGQKVRIIEDNHG
jgi:2-amino-4-hydroxy-6-hydroxymethyldihydropteridine diphosphokinase